MTTLEKKTTSSKKFKDLLIFQEKNIKFLESIKADTDLIYTYKQLLKYLQNLSQYEIEEIFKCQPAGGVLDITKKTSPFIELEAIKKMTVQQIKDEIAKPEVSRKLLENIASIKFGVTKGALSMLRSREALITKIHNLLSNEYTHEVISRAAGDKSTT